MIEKILIKLQAHYKTALKFILWNNLYGLVQT